MSDRYARIMAFITEYPWAMMESALHAMMAILEMRVDGGTFTEDEIEARLDAAATPRGGSRTVGAVAVLPLYGVIAPRMNAMTQVSGGTSAQAFGAAFRRAVDDPDIGALVIDVDSPGGSVFGIQELAATIRDARGAKPIIAVANTLAASAAYWLATQADELIVSPSSQVGSIGVVATHVDSSARDEKAGTKTTYITTAKYKAESMPGQPLTDEAREAMQELAAGYHRAFVADVAKGRGVSRQTVEASFGQGRIVAAGDAVKVGMADAVGTLDQVIARLASGKRRVAGSLGAEMILHGDPSAAEPQGVIDAAPEAEPVAPDTEKKSDDAAKFRLALAERGL